MLVGFGALMYISPRLNDSASAVASKLEDFQAKYDWSGSNTRNESVKAATEKWDLLQRNNECCGLNSPDDWRSFAPKNTTLIYPESCAQNSTSLDGETHLAQPIVKFWTKGCLSEIKATNGLVALIITLLVGLNLVLSVMACLVILCQPKSDYKDYHSVRINRYV